MALWKELIQQSAELMWPTRCIACNRPGELLCGACRPQFKWINQRWACRSCGAPYGWLCCTACDKHWEEFSSVVCSTSFEGWQAHMVSALKDEHETRLAPVMAAAMACSLDEASGWGRIQLSSLDAISFIPATQKAYMRRGFDHMELVARALSEFLLIPYVDVLYKQKTADQRGLSRQQRQINLRNSISLASDVCGAQLLLIDDVLTTGASMRAAAQALCYKGVKKIIGCTFSRVW